MEIEENRDLIDKKDSWDKFAGLVSVSLVNSVLELPHYSLYLSLSLLDTEFSWSILALDHERKRKEKKGRRRKQQARKSRIKHLQHDSLQVSICMCDFLARFGMQGIACGSLLLWHGLCQV